MRQHVPLAAKLFALHVAVVVAMLAAVWWSIENQAAGYFMELMKKFNIEPVEVNQMFLTANRRSLLWVGGITSAVLAVACVLYTRWLLRPLAAMGAAARRIAAGDYDCDVAARSSDELGQLAITFGQMARSLQQMELTRRRMIVDVGHELRTPLSNLRGYLEALQDGLLEPTPATLNSLHGELLRLIRLSEDLLQAARAGVATELRREPVDLRQIVAASAALFEPQLRGRNLHLTLALNEVEPLQGDPDRLRQICDNLLHNCVQFTPPGGSIEVRALARRGIQRLMYCNSGEGIAAADLPSIFEAYWRGDPSRSRGVAGGAGIGLAIVKSYAQAHGGSVGASSCAGTTRVWVDLPLRAAAGVTKTLPNATRSVTRRRYG